MSNCKPESHPAFSELNVILLKCILVQILETDVDQYSMSSHTLHKIRSLGRNNVKIEDIGPIGFIYFFLKSIDNLVREKGDTSCPGSIYLEKPVPKCLSHDLDLVI
jgi:hypothetical protein